MCEVMVLVSCVKCEGLLSVKCGVSKRKLLKNAVRTNFGSSIMREVGVGDSGLFVRRRMIRDGIGHPLGGPRPRLGDCLLTRRYFFVHFIFAVCWLCSVLCAGWDKVWCESGVWLVSHLDCSGIYQPRYADMGLTPVLRLLAQVLQLVIGASYRYIIRVPHAPKRIEILESLE